MSTNKNISHIDKNKLKFNKLLKFWFTLVELIVVIVILGILATIAFLSFSDQSGSARDSKRMSNVTMIAKWFEVAITRWSFINTSETSASYNVQINWTWWFYYSWFYDSPIKKKLLQSIWIWWWDIEVNDWIQIYKYTYIPSVWKYQIMSYLENQPNTSYLENLSSDIAHVFAETWSWYAFLKWNYTSTWWIVWLIPSDCVPSLTTVCVVDWWTETILPNTSVSLPESEETTPTWTWCIFDQSKFDQCTF